MTKRGRPNVRQSIGRTRQFMRWTLASVLALGGGGTAFASPASFSFPAPNEGWIPALLGGVPLNDPEGDTPGPRDIVGDQDNPMLFVAADETHLYFRLRVDSDPLQSATNFGPFGWGCFINTDSDPTTYEFSTIIDGVNNPDLISFFKNTTTTEPNSPSDEPDLPPISVVTDPLSAEVGHARVVEATSTFDDDPDYFIEWAIDRSASDAAGFDTSAPTLYYCGSSNNGPDIAADCSGSMEDDCPLESQFSDPVSCGAEGCGVCGDGDIEGSEGCDDGGLVGGDGCSALCLLELGEPCGVHPACESGFCDPDGGTCACDSDADCALGEVCSLPLTPNSCEPPGCGNAVIENGEGCDDGNTSPGDGCDDACLRELGEVCTLAPQCASGFCDPSDGTCACDDADDCALGELCNTTPDPNTCVAPGCGNAVIETGEACDDGNTSAGDGCDDQCLLELGQECDGPEDCASEFCSSNSDLCACDQDDDCADGRDCDGELCASPTCGDNALDTGEGCDDGNTDPGDGCNAQCLLELGEPCTDPAECASSFCDPDGDVCACDQSVDCLAGQSCETGSSPNQCVDPGCGNNVIESGEGCDDGNTVDDDGCSAACLLELGEPCDGPTVCESGRCDPDNSTCTCDEDADCAVGQACDVLSDPNRCVDPGCGNNVLDSGEGCDDGNLVPGDGCNTACLLELGQPCNDAGVCASNACDGTSSVCVCDDDNDCSEAEVCNTASVPPACVAAGCGNGVIEPGEGCDDANFDNQDGCTTQCLLELGEPCTDSATCASGLCDSDSDVCTCADDADCPLGQACDTEPDPNVCIAPNCGNGLIERGESCDDSNTDAGDGCDPTCRLELGEECETAAECASDACDAVDEVCTCNQDNDCEEGEICNEARSPNECVERGCGDGLVEMNEACDDGNTTAGDGCSAECLVELGEECDADDACASDLCDPDDNVCACDDDGDCGEGQLCNDGVDPNQCVSMGCGNGVVEAGEACDDANLTDGDGCDAMCRAELGEECDSDDACSSGLCDPMDAVCACDEDDDCGEGEFCDDDRDPNQCVGVSCGNGVIETGEACDDANLTDDDGCSGTCEVEPGFECVDEPSECEETGCQVDSDCAERQICDDGACVAVECTENSHCDAGETCDLASHRCGECSADDDCGPDFICDTASRQCRDKIYASGGGITCGVGREPASGQALVLLLGFGLVGGLLRRRRRR